MKFSIHIIAFLVWFFLMACTPSTNKTSRDKEALPTESFMKNMKSFCDKELKGEIFEDHYNPQNNGKHLLFSFNHCTDKEVRITVHLPNEEKNTIILTLINDEILLKHDMRNADMSPAEHTMFGGFSNESGTDSKQEFPVHNFGGDMWPGFEQYSWEIRINWEESLMEYMEYSENIVKKHYIIRLPQEL